MDQINQSRRQINHKVLRVVVGVIAFTLSPVVLFLSGDKDLTSISISYWTDSRDIFVGSLVAVGFFLSAYNGGGNGRDREYWLSKAACAFALCVAFFPTEGFSDEDVPATWVLAVSDSIGLLPDTIHSYASILLFVCLILLIWSFAARAKKKGKPGRAGFYRGVSIMMAAGILSVLIIGNVFELSKYVFWAEVWGLTLFGVGWFVAGSYQTEPLRDHAA